MKKIAVIVFTFILVFTMTACNLGTAIKMNLQKGEKFSMVYKIAVDQTQNMSGMATKLEQDMTMEGTFTITEVATDDFDMSFVFDRVFGTTNANDEVFEFDSNSTGEISNLYGVIINKPIKITADKRGNVTSLTGMNEVLQGILNSESSDSSSEQIKETLKQSFSDEALKQSFSNILTRYPNKSLKINDKWKEETTVEMGVFPVKVNSEYAYIGEDNNGHLLKVNGTFDVKDDNFKIGGTSAKIDLKGTQTGDMWINGSNNFEQKSKVTQVMTGTILIEGVSVDMVQNMDADVTILKK